MLIVSSSMFGEIPVFKEHSFKLLDKQILYNIKKIDNTEKVSSTVTWGIL